MVSRVLDASAFYAGIPFGSQDQCYVSSLVYDEVKHIKIDHDALGTLLETKRLTIMDPDQYHTDKVKKTAQMTGDLQQMSKEDISAVALCLHLKGELITDDFAVSNVSKRLGLKVVPVMTSGIKDVGRWVYYCRGCRKSFSSNLRRTTSSSQCPLCGNKLGRKLLEG